MCWRQKPLQSLPNNCAGSSRKYQIHPTQNAKRKRNHWSANFSWFNRFTPRFNHSTFFADRAVHFFATVLSIVLQHVLNYILICCSLISSERFFVISWFFWYLISLKNIIFHYVVTFVPFMFVTDLYGFISRLSRDIELSEYPKIERGTEVLTNNRGIIQSCSTETHRFLSEIRTFFESNLRSHLRNHWSANFSCFSWVFYSI